MSLTTFRFTDDDWKVESSPRRYALKVTGIPSDIRHIGPVMVLEIEEPRLKVADVDVYLHQTAGLSIESTYRFSGEVRVST